LKIDDLVEGVVYCDYLVKDFVCKPEPEYYEMVGSITDASLLIEITYPNA